MKRLHRTLAFAIALLPLACTPETIVDVPADPAYALPAGAQPLPPATRRLLQGVYAVQEGSRKFGDFVVLKWSYVADGPDTTHHLSIFSGRGVSWFILQGGSKDSTVHLSGYWRRMTTFETGNAALTIEPANGGSAILASAPHLPEAPLLITGRTDAGTGTDQEGFTLRYIRPVLVSQAFGIIAHRGGGRNSDMLPASENTVEMILMAERLGANGIEIDVRLTSDNVPVLYHDENLNLRLNEKNGLVGPLESYSYAQLQTFVRLTNGERIPTLREALDAVIDRTGLRIVWLDMKSAKESMGIVRAIQRTAMARANVQAAAGRRNPLAILIGLPDEAKVEEFLTLPDHREAPALCELDVAQVRRTGAAVWAPRWTLGTQPAEVAQMHAEGKSVVVWTLDVPQYIQQYVDQGDLDGILSNYPSAVAFIHYVRGPQ